jgi:hypothetical protein
MNYLTINPLITDVICIFPIAQQAIGFGSIIFNIIKIAKEVFLFLYSLSLYACKILFPYPLVTSEDPFDFTPIQDKLKSMEKSFDNGITVNQGQALSKEIQDLSVRISKCTEYFDDINSHYKKGVHYLDNMKIGFYRSIPGFGTFYSLRQCYKKWQPNIA